MNKRILQTLLLLCCVAAPAGARDLPGPWKRQDIGHPRFASTVSEERGAFTVKASGWGLWGPEDSCAFVYQEFEGDGQIIAHVAAKAEEDLAASAGVMIRQNLEADSPFAAAMLSPSGNVHFNRRPNRGAGNYQRPEGAPAYSWVRVTRDGEEFSAYRSTDGKSWELIDTSRIAMPGKVLIGLAAATRTNSGVGAARIDSVVIAKGKPYHTFYRDSKYPGRGVVLRDGSAIAGELKFAEMGVKVGKREVDLQGVSLLLFNPAPPDLEKIVGGHAGILLTTGDFLEGEFDGVEGDRIRMKSVLFGAKHFRIPDEVIAVSLPSK